MQLILISLLLLLASCSSPQRKQNADPSPEEPRKIKSKVTLQELKRQLGLNGSDQLGFQEKVFSPCSIGYSAPDETCSDKFLVIVNFRVQCRNSEGTVSTALEESDLFPIKGASLSWRLKGLDGVSRLDDHGFGQIETVSVISQKKQWLRLSNGDDFLNVRAGEINRIVTPKNWCDSKKYSQW